MFPMLVFAMRMPRLRSPDTRPMATTWSIVMTALTPNVQLLPGPANVYAQAFDLYDYSFTAMYGQVLLVR